MASFFKLDTRPTHSEIVFPPTKAREWNALPSKIISSNSIESFRKNIELPGQACSTVIINCSCFS